MSANRLQRSIRELDGRRRRVLLEGRDDSLFLVDGVVRFDWVPVVFAFALSCVVIIVTDDGIATIQHVPPRLGWGWSVVVAAGVAAVFAAYLHWRQRPRSVPAPDPKRVADALKREREIDSEDIVRLEHLEIDAARAFGVFDGRRLQLVVLDCGDDTFAFVRGPLLDAHVRDSWTTTVPSRWVLDALRWTRAILFLIAGGALVPMRRLEIDAELLASLGECEVRRAGELPEPLADRLRSP